MISRLSARSGTPHLFSALVACAIVIAILCSGRLLAIYLEGKTVHWIAPRDFFIKNQGLAFERAAARRPDIFLLYGSSELIDPIPNRASDFFSSAPTGFQVCPVGKAGTTSLIILQKLGALGSELRGRKVAISLSALWVSCKSSCSICKIMLKRWFTSSAEASRSQIGCDRSIRTRCIRTRRPLAAAGRRRPPSHSMQFIRPEMRHFAGGSPLQANG